MDGEGLAPTTGRVVVRRLSHWSGRFGTAVVLVDGSQVARLRNGRTTEIRLSVGEHLVEAKLFGGTSSNPLTIHVAADTVVAIDFGPSANFWPGIYESVLHPENFLHLRFSERREPF